MVMMKVTPEQRAAWVANTRDDKFNTWFNPQVRNVDGTLNLEKLYAVAGQHGVTARYDHLNPGQQRMNIGKLLRKRVLLA
jgi:hypothetical protein